METNSSNKRQAGQGLVEYALILTTVALVVVVVLVLFGPALGRMFTSVIESLGPQSQAAAPSASPSGPSLTEAPGGTAVPTNAAVASLTGAPSDTPAPSSTMLPSDTPAPSSTMLPSDTPAPSSTLPASDTPAPTSTAAPSSTTVAGLPTSTPVPTNTLVPSSTPAPTNTRVPSSTPAPTNTPVPSSTPAPTYTPVPTNTPAPTSTPITGNIVSASAARTGGGSGNALDVSITVSSATTVSVIDSVGGSRASNVACSGTCTVHLGSIGKDAGYVAIVAANGGTLTAWYPAKN